MDCLFLFHSFEIRLVIPADLAGIIEYEDKLLRLVLHFIRLAYCQRIADEKLRCVCMCARNRLYSWRIQPC